MSRDGDNPYNSNRHRHAGATLYSPPITNSDRSGDADSDIHGMMSVSDFSDCIAVLVEQGELDWLRGQILIDYIEDNNFNGEVTGPLKTAYRIAEYAQNAQILSEALTVLSETIVKDAEKDGSNDTSSGAHLTVTNMDFLLDASETAFVESQHQLSASTTSTVDVPLAPGQLWALHNAILHSHPSIVAIYDAYRKALERAFDLNATLNGGDASLISKAEDDEGIERALEFLLHALTRVGQAMDPIEQGTSGTEEDQVLHVAKELEESLVTLNEMDSLAEILEAAVVDVLPDSLQKIAYELLMEGDVFLQAALKSFLLEGNAKRLHDDIFFRLRLRLESMEAEESYLLHKVAASDAASITEVGLGARKQKPSRPS